MEVHHTEHMKMACSVVPMEKCWPEDARWSMMGWGGRGELPTWPSSWGGAGSWLWFPSQLPQNKQRAGQQPWLKGVGGLLWWLSGKESACQCRRPELNLGVGKIPWWRKWHPTPVFLPREPGGQRTWWAIVHGVAKSWTRLKDWTIESSQLRGTHTVPDSWHVNSISTMNTSLSFLSISSVPIVNLSKTFHF